MSAAAAAASMRQTRITILLSLNAVAIVIAGVLIASAIGLTGEGGLNVVAERSDITDGSAEAMELVDAGTDHVEGDDSSGGTPIVITPAAPNSTTASGETTDANGKATGGSVPNGELWNETSMTLYQSADKDICIDDSLPGYNNMYWQTSNKGVISAFYGEARTYLGYNSNKCRTPVIVGTGTTTITAGTLDGTRRDTIEITVLPVPVEQWKQEVLQLVNNERAKAGLPGLAWGNSCAAAAMTRATEIQTSYSHTRPDGTPWTTVCPTPAGHWSGENLAIGANAASPSAVVAAWMASESHRANILGANFKYLSVGFVFDPNSKYKTFWSQIFTSW